MRSKASKLLVYLSLATVLALVAVVGLEALLDNRKDAIRRNIEGAIGRAVAFDSISLNFLGSPGNLGVTVTNLRVADDPKFAATPLIHADQLTISLGWLSLLTGRPTVSNIVLYRPEIQVIRNEYGDINILTPSRRLDASLRSAHGAALAVHANGGKLYFIDRSSEKPEELRLHDLALALQWSRDPSIHVDVSGALASDGGQPFSLAGTVGTAQPLARWADNTVDLEMRAASLPQVLVARGWRLLENRLPAYFRPSAPLEVSARVSGSLHRPRVSRMSVTGALFGAAVDNARLAGELDFSRAASWNEGLIKAKLQLGPVNLDQLRQIPWVDRVVPAGLSAHQPLSLSNLVEGSFDNLNIHTSVTADANHLRYGRWLDKAPGVVARLDMKTRVRGDRVVIYESEARLHNGTVVFSGSVDQHPEQVVRLRIKTGDVALAGWEALVPAAAGYRLDGTLSAGLSLRQKSAPRNEPPTLLGSLRLANVNIIGPPGGHRNIQGIQGELEFRGNDVEIRQLQLRSGLSDLRVRGLLVNLSRPTLHYNVQSDLLNLADITGDAAYRADSFNNVVSEGSAGFTKGVLSVKGFLASSNGRLKGLAYSNLQGRMDWAGGNLKVDRLGVETLGGKIHGDVALTKRNGQGFDLALNPTAENVDLRSLLSLFPNGAVDSVNGRMNLRGRFRGTGNDWAEVVRNLDGLGNVTLDKGVLGKFNPVRGVLTAMDAVEGIDKIETAGTAFISLVRDARTSFKSIEGTFAIDEGRLRSDDLLLIADEYSIVGRGWASHDGGVGLQATLVLSSAFSRDLSGRHRNVRYLFDADGISVPFRLTGKIPDIVIEPDVMQLTRYMYDRLAQERPSKPDDADGFNLWKRLGRGFRELLR